MSLNIKSERTHRLVQELARLTGETQTAAVTSAVEEKLERLLAQQAHERLSERILDIGRDIGLRLGAEALSTDHGELLYDEAGLPR